MCVVTTTHLVDVTEEGGEAQAHWLNGLYPGEEFVGEWYAGRRGRHPAAHVGKVHNQADLLHVHTFPAGVRPRHNVDPATGSLAHPEDHAAAILAKSAY